MNRETVEQMEERIRDKQARVKQLDENLLKELQRQKIIAELMESYVSSVSSSYSGSTQKQNSQYNRSVNSGQSYDTDLVQFQLERVKNYMNNLRNNDNRHEKTIKYQKQPDVKPQIKSKYLNQFQNNYTKKNGLNNQEQSFQLTIFPEQKNIVEYQIPKTIFINRDQRKQIQQKMRAKHRRRQEELNRERQSIRKQLIEQQSIYNHNNQAKILQFPSNFYKYDIQDKNETLKDFRNSKISSLLRQISKQKKKGTALQTKIKNYSIYI